MTYELAHDETVGERAARLYPSIDWDSALPQSFVDACLARGFDPVGCVIWGYPSGEPLGRPLPLTRHAAHKLAE